MFIVSTAVGALVGYGIGRFYGKVNEEKQKNPDVSTCAAVKSVFSSVFTTKHSESKILHN